MKLGWVGDAWNILAILVDANVVDEDMNSNGFLILNFFRLLYKVCEACAWPVKIEKKLAY